MASYVNDLRLKEIGTGESSGTWGSETNTNLELIGEALGFGTEGITTNADTHTTTIADGSTDPGRAMYLKYTGTLDSACTITIAPNTISRMQFIENGTSGSQNIIISQGTGANVTIPAGDTKAIYLDGAGSGAAVVDAYASLNVVDLKVQDDLTVTDDVAISGLVTIGETLGVTGVVTANAGVAIDNITIDGTEIDLSSGDLTLDVAGNIVLDADGGGVYFKDGGTTIGFFQNDSSDFRMISSVSDKDIKFLGNDGGATITALTLDMSDAGTAIFNHDAVFADNGIAKFGAGSDLQIYHSSSDNNSYIEESGSGSLVIKADDLYIQNAAGSENMALFVEDGAATLYHDNSAKIATTSTGATTTGLHTSTQSANITQVAITSSSNAVAWDARAAANAYHVTTENTTFSAPSNAVEGAIISVEIAQGGTARTIAWNTVFEFAASTAPTITATANKTDILSFRYNGSVWQEIGRSQNMAQT
mgnify:CR=1 FL=1